MANRNAKRATVKQRKISERSLANLKPFVKGDPRINRLGRPKTFDQIRDLVQDIAADMVEPQQGWSRIEVMLRQMFISKSAQDRQNILEYGWGAVPKAIQLDVTEELRRLMRDLNLTPTDIASDPALSMLFGMAGVKVEERNDD